MSYYDAVWRSPRSRVALSRARALVYLVGLLVGSIVAALTFDPAIDTAVSLIRVVAALDFDAFAPGEFLVMVVFFVSFGVAIRSLDRLLLGGIRSIRAR